MTNHAPRNRDNPLHRRIDRVERLSVRLAVLVFAAFIPLGIHLSGEVRDSLRAAGEREAQTKSTVDAVLLEDARKAPVPGDSTGHTYVAEAGWQTNTGQTFRGTIDASPGDRAGDTISTWIDTSGQATDPPRTPADTDVAASLTAFGVIGGGLILVGGTFLVIRSRLNHDRMRNWDHQWAILEPVWSGRSRSA